MIVEEDTIKQQLQIVIVTYNRKEYLKHTLDMLLADNSPVKNFEIIVINNNSTDGTTEMLDIYANTNENITHVTNKINIGGSANVCKAFNEYSDKKYVWVIADNDTYNWQSWNEIEYAINNDYDVIMTRNCKNNISKLFYEAAFVPACIYKTKNITPDIIENMYDNIRFLFPHLAIMAENLNKNKKIFIVENDIVKVEPNPGYTTTMFRGRKAEEVPPFRRNMYWSVGFFNSLVLIKDRKKQIEIIDGLRHYHKTLFELFRSIIIYNKTIANNYFPNLLSIFLVLNFNQKIKFLLAYLSVHLSLKDYAYWFIRYSEEWIEYLKKINEQKYIDKLAKKLKNKKVVLYGCGMLSEILFKNYDLSKLNIVGISDKRFETSGENEFYSIKTIKPSELAKTEFDILLFTMKLYKQIEKSLHKQGIKQSSYSIIANRLKYPIRT